ncbi:glycosyl transferase family 2 [Halothece sp. PCC 7418]|uniref:glycosyltransferase family 2 protein n=1 Tax=Halothece sp. (strain PCC 7418) TaxID=65093 RepID=UPI0002A069B3|nr:glycosyltransferase family 2 protein [Halothece sp. PCC 7418]AFZ44049.1 glycosyl transferase family 2 [Halothece sp. PCC 7418]
MRYSNPILTLGMPIYNGERFLRETLESILNQTFENFELIISDNASTDKTQAICQEYAAQDQRICYYCNDDNLGAARNYNRVFQLSKGTYFKWVAHDDLLAPEYLERCIEVLEQNSALVLCYSRTIFIDQEGNEIRKASSNLLQLTSPKPHQRFEQYQKLFFNKGRLDRQGSNLKEKPIKADSDLTQHHPAGDRWLPIFGVIRSNLLKGTPLIASYVNSDAILLGELALLGQFYEVPEYLFRYRDYGEASGRKHNGYYEYNVWFDPVNKNKIVMPLWRWFWEYLAAIQRSPLNRSETTLCYAQMAQWLRWMWQRLAKELLITSLRALKINQISIGKIKKQLPTQW